MIIFRIIQEENFHQPLEIQAIANVRKVVTRDCRWALRMISDELNISKETIRQILHEEEDLRKVRPTQTHGQAEPTETHTKPRIHRNLSRQSSFSWLHSSLSCGKNRAQRKEVSGC
jgi:DeoR/GlpR family transcriptional regulator of sugar metabolism